MKYHSFIYAIILLITLTALPASAKIVISKIQTSGVSTTDEFIELYNSGDTTTSLASWSLKKLTASGSASNIISSFASAIFINPWSYFLIGHRDYQPINNTNADIFYSNNSTSLADNNSVVLTDNSGTVIDRVDWGSTTPLNGSPAPNPGAHKSLVRLLSDTNGDAADTDDSSRDFNILDSSPFNSQSAPHFISPPAPAIDQPPSSTTTTTETPSTTPPVDTPSSTETNSPTSTPDDISSSTTNTPSTTPEISPPLATPTSTELWEQIKINEVMPNPATGTEWVELYNPSVSSIDVTGGILCDGRSSSCTVSTLTSTIPARGWLTVYLSNTYLNNTGDKLILKNPAGHTVDEMSYGSDSLKTDTDQSVARITDGTDTNSNFDWAVTSRSTPNSTNVIVAPLVSTPKSSTSGSGVISPPLTTSSNTPSKPATTTPFVWKLDVPEFGVINTPLSFNAAGTADPRGGTVHFSWNFGDGSTATGTAPSHIFRAAGTYTISVTGSSTAHTAETKKFNFIVSEIATSSARTILLSEIFPNPEGADTEEFIEIENFGTEAVDVAGWRIILQNGKYFTFPNNTSLAPDETRTFFRVVSRLSLGNSGGTVTLVTKNNQIIDSVRYEKSIEDKSWQKNSDIWVWGEPSPNEANSTSNDTPTVTMAPAASPKTKKSSRTPYLGNISLATARAADTGAQAVVQGTVVALPNTFGTQYFYITDDTGGLPIFSSKKDFPQLALGDRVQIVGQVSSANGLKRINIKGRASVRHLPTKFYSTTTTLQTLDELSEDTLGTLITVAGEITSLKTTFMYVDDGTDELMVYFKAGAHIEKSAYKIGDHVQITGILEQTKTGWQLWPRGVADITFATLSPEQQQKQAALLAAENKKVTKEYTAATAGGATALLFTWLARARGAFLVGGIKRVGKFALGLVKKSGQPNIS